MIVIQPIILIDLKLSIIPVLIKRNPTTIIGSEEINIFMKRSLFSTKLIISLTIFATFLIVTSAIKNETRLIEKKISNLKKGISYIDRIKNIDLRKFSKKLFSSNFKNIQYCDVIIICVPTPLKGKNDPNLDFIKNTIQDIINLLKAFMI